MDSFTPTTDSTVNAELTPHREYKSRLFAMLFSDKEKLLELYNAMTKKHYTNPDALQINTLENAIYISMHNDLSFIIDSRVCLYDTSLHTVRICHCEVCFIFQIYIPG